MARRSAARRGGAAAEPTDGGYPDEWDVEPSAAAPSRRPRPRAGAGGRFWIWFGRAVLWAFIIVVIINGIWLPFRDGFGIAAPATEDDPTEDTTVTSYPETAAAAFALGFAEVYLNAGEDPTERADELAGFLPEGRATDLNLPSDAELRADDFLVAGVIPHDEHYAVVSLSARVNGERMGLDVPVYTDDGTAFVVSGQPALLAAPPTAVLPDPPDTSIDTAVRDQLENDLRLFFTHYAEDPDLVNGLVEDGRQIPPLPEGTLELAELGDIIVPEATAGGDEDVREVRASVVWQFTGDDADTPLQLTQSYQVTVVADGTSWKVRDIQGAPRSFGD